MFEVEGNNEIDSNDILKILEILILISIGFCVLGCASYLCIQIKQALNEEDEDVLGQRSLSGI